jgi:hypothetical protein
LGRRVLLEQFVVEQAQLACLEDLALAPGGRAFDFVHLVNADVQAVGLAEVRVREKHLPQLSIAFARLLGMGLRRWRRLASGRRRRARQARGHALALLRAQEGHRPHLAPRFRLEVGIGVHAQPLAQLGCERHRLDMLLRGHASVGLDIGHTHTRERGQ